MRQSGSYSTVDEQVEKYRGSVLDVDATELKTRAAGRRLVE